MATRRTASPRIKATVEDCDVLRRCIAGLLELGAAGRGTVQYEGQGPGCRSAVLCPDDAQRLVPLLRLCL